MADNTASLPHGPLGRALESATRIWALVGGFVLLAVMVISSASVILRSLPQMLAPFGVTVKTRGISGDIEIVQVGCAVAIFAFLPYCQMIRGNVFVDFFTKQMPVRIRSLLDLLANLLYLALVLAIAVQLGHGTMEQWRNNGTTMVLRIPEVWPYAISLVSAWLLVAVTAYTVARSAAEIRANRVIGPQPSGEH